MNKRAVVLLIFFLVIVGIILIGKQREQAMQLEQMETTAANELRRVAAKAQAAKQQAIEETRRIEAEAARAKQAALEKARMAEEEAQKAKESAEESIMQKAEEIQVKINDLVARATVFLDTAEYQKAIDVAQQILGLDPNSDEANSIIEKATAKLKEVATKQVEALKMGVQEQIAIPQGAEIAVPPQQPAE